MHKIENINIKGYFWSIITILLLTDLAILLDIPFLRQTLGFLFLTILPGLLVLQILKLNKIGPIEKLVLSVGLSISFLMFFGLLINNLLLYFSYEIPLSTVSLLILFNIAFIVLAIVGYKLNKDSPLFLPNIDLTTSEKAFLIVPILFPALSIFGMYVMNTTDNNIILMFLLFLIPIYVAFACFFNQKFPKRLYPVVIFLISISLLLMLSLRSNHLIGVDTHTEYYFFRTTWGNLHWSVFGHSTLDACLSISLLPTIYQSILNISPEFLFKILYSLIYSVSPLVIYVISKKYVEEGYAFLASCFFMFQLQFLWTALNARTNTAILFFALAMMVLFSDKIDPLKKRILFIVFMASCMVSHYATTYIFFFIMLSAFIGMEIVSKKCTFKKVISLTIVILFFSMIFLWYSQVTETSFNAGVDYIGNTLTNLNQFFIEESRKEGVQQIFGKGFEQENVPYKIQFAFSWLMLAFIGIGIVTLIIKHKEMSFPELNFKKSDFLKEKFEVGYFTIALACVGVLVAIVALPYVSTGYGIDRLYAAMITILSVFFVIGGIVLAKNLSLNLLRKVISKTLRRKKALPKKQKEGKNALQTPLRKNVDGKDTSQVRAYLIILLVLIPYFFCVTDVTYHMLGVPRAITLNSEGREYDRMYIHDQENYCAKWLKSHTDEKAKIYGDYFGSARLRSQGMIRTPIYAGSFIVKGQAIKSGYIYLRYTGVVNGKLLDGYGEWHNVTEYEGKFGDNCKIYANGGSEVWR